ncbi:hypothetical protein JKI95_00990 [Corynebacterium aquatimens]|uniref:hypothetical protein n=1 Tax=Corynebacterium aquatimens TaxID=1190508 RepID=UPI002541DEEF|nr:hypothetical protein [Corynebacterium aquatimens]QYH19775.1 hypothetical protein JKI95_00990 [Corynebacterium aquatimens]
MVNFRRTAGAAAVACLTVIAVPVPAQAQLPAGLDPAQVQSMIPSQVSVRAGETTSVDVGVPVDVNYHSGGWSVTPNGTTVSVTAPDSPGATANVPASALGYTATITLVATGEGSKAGGRGAGQPAGGQGVRGKAASLVRGLPIRPRPTTPAKAVTELRLRQMEGRSRAMQVRRAPRVLPERLALQQ